jgi:hypothetical protein
VSATSTPLFRFVQVEFAWPLGPPDGRYLLRPRDQPGGDPANVIVFATLGAVERRRLARLRKQREAPAQPEPTPVSTGRATVIDVDQRLTDMTQARDWLRGAGEEELIRGLEVLNRALQAFRLVTADPDLHTVSRRQALVARVGFGAGEEVADGLWTDARELLLADGRPRRSRVLEPQARLAAVLAAREQSLACEELALRARQDLDHGREREGALQVMVALDAAVAELTRDPAALALADRLTDLRGQREAVATAAQSALSGALTSTERDAVASALQRIESALRARAVANA